MAAVASSSFSGIEGAVCLPQHLFGRHGTPISAGQDSDADGDGQISARAGYRDAADGFAYLLGAIERATFVAVAEYHEELLSAVASDEVVGADRFCKPAGYLAQDLVAYHVAEGIVHQLKVIDVDNEQSDAAIFATCAAQLTLQQIEDHAAIEQRCEGIVGSFVAHLLVRVDEAVFQSLLRRQVAADADETGDTAIFVPVGNFGGQGPDMISTDVLIPSALADRFAILHDCLFIFEESGGDWMGKEAEVVLADDVCVGRAGGELAQRPVGENEFALPVLDVDPVGQTVDDGAENLHIRFVVGVYACRGGRGRGAAIEVKMGRRGAEKCEDQDSRFRPARGAMRKPEVLENEKGGNARDGKAGLERQKLVLIEASIAVWFTHQGLYSTPAKLGQGLAEGNEDLSAAKESDVPATDPVLKQLSAEQGERRGLW